MNGRKQFESLRATQLYCPRCRAATPVRERLLLVLPDGETHEYICTRCGDSIGKKKVRPIAGGIALTGRPGGGFYA